MRLNLLFVLIMLSVATSWGFNPQEELEQLKDRENSPAFRKAVIAYQTVREMYRNASSLPSIKPLKELIDDYNTFADSQARIEPLIAASAFDRILQIGFILGERNDVLQGLERIEKRHPEVV